MTGSSSPAAYSAELAASAPASASTLQGPQPAVVLTAVRHLEWARCVAPDRVHEAHNRLDGLFAALSVRDSDTVRLHRLRARGRWRW